MAKSIPRCMSAKIIGKGHDLAERRRTHMIDLYDTGRWKRYYSEEEFVALMRETVRLADSWSRMAEPLQAAE